MKTLFSSRSIRRAGACAALCVVLVPWAALGDTYSIQLDLNNPDGHYETGETATCTAALFRDGEPAAGQIGRCTVKFECKPVQVEEFDAGQPFSVTASSDVPGWIYFGFEVLGEDGQPLRGSGVYAHHAKPTIVGEIGALFDPEQIQAAPSRPDDFDAYWADCRDQVDQVPLAPVLTPVRMPSSYEGSVECYEIEVPCPGKNPVRGYLALPARAKPGGLPALVDYQSLVWQDTSRTRAIRAAANHTCLALYVSWHGLPTGHPPSYYKTKAKTWYHKKGGSVAGDTHRDTWFYHDMYLRAMRALDFIKSRPEWNQKDLIVQGGSLGGPQAFAAAALDPQVTLAVISVPTFCEFNAYESGRQAPLAYRKKSGLKRLLADPRRAEALSYHDGVNFAPRITCETYVCTGFTDELCTPSTVYAFYNALPDDTPKTMTTNPRTGHYGTTPNVKGNRRLQKFFDNVVVDLFPGD